jgi:hypothetical protein
MAESDEFYYTGKNRKKYNRGRKLSDAEETHIRITADTSEAIRSIKELERQANKIADIGEQGAKQQRGFLSPKQVLLVRRMLQEIEQTYQAHYKKLQDMEKEHATKKEKIEKEILKRQQELDYAEGSNEFGDVLPDDEIARRRQKLEQSKSNLGSLSDLEAEISGIHAAVDQLKGQRDRANTRYTDQISEMHEMTPSAQKSIRGITNLASSAGMVLSVQALASYIGKGMGTIVGQQYKASDLGQKLADYQGDDEGLRKNLKDTGNINQFKFAETAITARELMKGGTHDTNLLRKDIESTQEAGRAYAVDPNLIAQGGTLLKQMGTLEEGQMQRFANLIGGAITKNSMKGREEEQLRSSMSLISQATNQLAEATKGQVGNVLGMQSWLSQAVPTLRGDRGAQVLSNMDASIKGADNTGDILMGWGTKYKGIEGRYQLDMVKEEGIANRGNVQEMFKNAKSMLGSNSKYKQMALKQVFGMSLHDIEALEKAGALESMENGTALTTDAMSELQGTGSGDLMTQLEKYNKTEAKRTRLNEADDESLKTGMAKYPSKLWQRTKTLFHSQPESLQAAEIVGGAIFGGKMINPLLRKGAETIFKGVNPNIGGGGGLWNGLKGIFSKGATAEGANAGAGMFSNLGSHMKTGWGQMDDAARWGGAYASTYADDAIKAGINSSSKFGSSFFKGAGTLLGKGGGMMTKYGAKALPVVGTAVSAGVNKVSGDSWGKSLTKAGIGTGLMMGAGVLLAPFTGGLSLGATLALGAGVTVGSTVAGDAIGNAIYKDEGKTSTGDISDSAIETIVRDNKGELAQAKALSKATGRSMPEAQLMLQAYMNKQKSKKKVTSVPKVAPVPKVTAPVVTPVPGSSKGTASVKNEFSNSPIDGNSGKSIDPYANTSTQQSTSQYFQSTVPNGSTKLANMQVTTMKVDKIELTSDSKSSDVEGSLKKASGEHVLKIVIDGKIEGMDTGNQTQIKNSVVDYFRSLLDGGSSGGHQVNLAYDTKWK